MFSPRVGFNWDVRERQEHPGPRRRRPLLRPDALRLDLQPVSPTPAWSSPASTSGTRPSPSCPTPSTSPRAGDRPHQRGRPDRLEFHLSPGRSAANLAVDQELPFGIIGTVEFVYSKNVNEILYQNLNLRDRRDALGMGGRYLYARDVIRASLHRRHLPDQHQQRLPVQPVGPAPEELHRPLLGQRLLLLRPVQGRQLRHLLPGRLQLRLQQHPLQRQRSRADLVELRRPPSLSASPSPGSSTSCKNAPTSLSMFYGGRSGPALFDHLQLSSTPTATRPRATTWSTSPPARAKSSSSTARAARLLADQDAAWASFDAFIGGDPGLRQLPRPDRAAQLEPRALGPRTWTCASPRTSPSPS